MRKIAAHCRALIAHALPAVVGRCALQVEEVGLQPPPGFSSLFDLKCQPAVPSGPLTARGSQQRELAEAMLAKVQPAK